jgi:toxin FitB
VRHLRDNRGTRAVGRETTLGNPCPDRAGRDERVAWKWGQLSVEAERRGRARPINDTWIAACCLVADLSLATMNLKDFEDFAEHDGLRLISPSES